MQFESRSARLFRTLAAAVAMPFLLALSPATSDASTWPGLRGPGYDGAVRDEPLFGELPDEARATLEVAWQRELGSGYSVVVADADRVVAAFQSGARDVVAAFDPASGDEIWRYEIGEAYAGHSGSHDGPIATPVLAGGKVFGLGPRGDLFALDGATGQAHWASNVAEDFEVEAPFYGFGASPIVVDDVLVVPVGAGEDKSIAGFDVATGERVWGVGAGAVEYNSPILASLGGRSQIVAADDKILRGIDPSSGAVLWSHEHGGDERAMGGATIVPVPAGDNRLLLLSQQGESVLVEVIREEESWQVAEVWRTSAIKATYVQPVYHEGHVYGMNGKIFTCIDAETGEMKWRSRAPGDGFPTLVGDHLVIMTKPGVLRVAEASPEGYQELASVGLFESVSWSAPAYAGGSLYVRSINSLARVDPVVQASAAADQVPAATGDSEAAVAAAATATAAAERSDGFARFLEALGELDGDAARSALIDAYLAERSVPVIEPTGAVHFLYRGEATDVGIVGDMIGLRREEGMTRVAGTDLFYYSTRLEPDAAVHYGFLVDFGEPIPDPLNPLSGDSLFDEVSFLAMPAYYPEDFSEAAEEARQGRLEEVSWESAAFENETRAAMVYLPAGYDAGGTTRYPVLYVHDGQEALEDGRFKNALDRLIGDSVVPLIAVFVTPADPENGSREFRNPAYAEMFSNELVPMIEELFRTLDDPSSRATAGAGRAADMSLRLAFGAPERFGRVGALWPVLFGFDAAPPPAQERPLVIYQKWGSYHLRSPHENFDSNVYNHELRQRLRDHGHRPTGGEVPEGLGWNNFRGYVGEMLRVLYPAV